jgi:DNA-binding NarL/FixJ family response regulator
VIRLVIIDDHPIARWGLEHLIADHDDITSVTSVASEAELPPGLDFDVAAVDLYLAGDEPALETIGRLSTGHRVLVISASARDHDVIAALEAGAGGYLTKDASDEELLDALRAVAHGGFYLSRSVADVLHRQRKPRGGAQPPPLSAREREALALVARGFTHTQAALRMQIAPSTFDSHIERIRRKLDLGNKAELTRTAIEMGLTKD